ncbi:MAG: DNA-binding protein [Actinomycetota bacterium]|nr:DNA-binding protein [Actinomycetota bacterium]
MSAHRDAHLHLNKAREFLEAAEGNHARDLYNVAASAAVTSGINSKDAVCLATKGVTGKSDSHTGAVGELRQSGPTGVAMASTFNRLLGVKVRAQYQTRAITAKGSRGAVTWAARMYEAAQRVVPE